MASHGRFGDPTWKVTMALSRDFFETIKKQADKSKAFRVGMLKEAVDAFVTGDPDVGRIMLRDYVKATIGFEELARRLDLQSSSIKRMLSPKGNPSTNNLAAIMEVLQAHEGIILGVVEKRQARQRNVETA